jgi:DNA repair exonuclease SbcCD ATPase subunit
MIGGVALLFVNAIVGGVVLGIGCVLFAVGAILFFKKQNTDGKTAIQPNLDLARLQAESKGLTDEVRAFLVPFGYYSPDGIAVDFATFENSLAEYKQILAINAQRSAQIEDKKSKCAQLTAQINDRFNNYGVSSQNAQSAYISLEHEIVEFNSLKGEQIRATEGEARLNSQIEESQQTIIQTLDKYNLPLEQNLAEQFEKLDKDRSERERLTQSIAMWTAQAETYKEQNGLTQMPEGQAVDVDELNGQLSEKRRALAVIEGQISDAESIVEKLDEKKAQLENEEEKLAGYRRKLTVVSGAIDSLKQAETNLKDKYVMPIKDKFIHYSDILEKALGEKVTMDQDFRVTFERGGENRSDKHFSAGQRNILALCFRLALIDNMYENEKPFIIMDDPFVNLDENHIEKARTLVKQLAGDKQIIYFCCHESRKI